MNENVRILENHPRYQEYVNKCKSLGETFFKIKYELKAKYPDWRGLDHPADLEIRPYEKQFYADLKKLQEEYAFLFVKE